MIRALLRLFAANNVIGIGAREMMMMPMPKDRQAEMEWPEPEGQGRNWRRRSENGRQSGNQKKSTELSHGLAPRNVDGRETLTEPVSSIRWILEKIRDIKNNYVDGPARQHDINRCLADRQQTNRGTVQMPFKLCQSVFEGAPLARSIRNLSRR
jgi:hypothetical protein